MLGKKDEPQTTEKKTGFSGATISITGDMGTVTVPLDARSSLSLTAPVERIAACALDNIGGWLLGAAKPYTRVEK